MRKMGDRMTVLETEMVLLNLGGGMYELQGWQIPEKKPVVTSHPSKSTPAEKVQVPKGNAAGEKGVGRK